MYTFFFFSPSRVVTSEYRVVVPVEFGGILSNGSSTDILSVHITVCNRPCVIPLNLCKTLRSRYFRDPEDSTVYEDFLVYPARRGSQDQKDLKVRIHNYFAVIFYCIRYLRTRLFCLFFIVVE